MSRWLLVFVLLAAPAVHAATYVGRVTHVVDGDTLWVRPARGGAPVEIRLLDLDAPESCQRWGPQAHDALRSRVRNENVTVHSRGVDDYGRQIARIEWRGQDVGRWLVRHGYAWSMSFRGRAGPYAPLEAQARRDRKGLWSEPTALEPRVFRQQHGRCR